MIKFIEIQRLSAGSIYKLLFIGSTVTCVPLGLVFGVLAYFGADTVTWNGEPLTGFLGLVAGPLMGLFLVAWVVAFIGTVSVLGLWVYSKFRPITLVIREVAADGNTRV